MIARAILVWLLLLLLLGAELALVRTGFGTLTPILGLAMAAIVALGFMRLGGAPTLGRIFAAAGLFWLCVLLGLGSVDYVTRAPAPALHSAPDLRVSSVDRHEALGEAQLHADQYAAEVHQHPEQLSRLRALARSGPITLVFSAHDKVDNDAVALRNSFLRRETRGKAETAHR